MSLIPVPALKAKFALLRGYSARKHWADLAGAFKVGARTKVSAKTLQYWCDGSPTRAADQMPPAALSVLLDLFAAILPRSPGRDEVRRLVLGPLAQLEAELRAGASVSFADLLAREGQTDTGVLILKSAESGLIEAENDAEPMAEARVALGAWFRLRFPVPAACSYAVVFQNVQSAWAVVPSVLESEMVRHVLVPGLAHGGALRHMRERRDAGRHRFICLQAAAPFPLLVEEHARENLVLDQRGLDALAAFYLGQKAAQRACHVLAVTVEPDGAE